jgi:hypothetical protein
MDLNVLQSPMEQLMSAVILPSLSHQSAIESFVEKQMQIVFFSRILEYLTKNESSSYLSVQIPQQWPCMIRYEASRIISVREAMDLTMNPYVSPFLEGVTYRLDEALVIDMKNAKPVSEQPVETLRIAEGAIMALITDRLDRERVELQPVQFLNVNVSHLQPLGVSSDGRVVLNTTDAQFLKLQAEWFDC